MLNRNFNFFAMKVLIFAAGLGTRLKPLTDRKPKALVEAGGRPLLEWLLLKLKNQGFTDIVINVHHFADQIKDFVRVNNSFGLDIKFSDETDLLRDTGGGIRHAESLLNDSEPFLVHNVDIASDLDLMKFYRESAEKIEKSCCEIGGEDGIKKSILSVLVVSRRENERRLLFDSEGDLAAWENLKTGEVKSPYPQLAAAKAGTEAIASFSPFSFAGIHVISPQIFELMRAMPEKFPIVEFYLSQAASYNIKSFCKPDLRLVDVGKVEHIPDASALFKSMNS